MLNAAIAMFLLAIIAAIFGFSGIAASAAGLAKLFAVVFLVLGVVSFLFGRARRAV